MLDRSTTKTIYLLRKLIGLYRDRKVDIHMVFIDLKNAYDRVSYKVLKKCSEKKGMSLMYIRVPKNTYERGRMSVRTIGGVTNDFFISMGLH